MIEGAGCSGLIARAVTAPWSLASSSLFGSRGSRSTTENSERSSLASISGAELVGKGDEAGRLCRALLHHGGGEHDAEQVR